MGGAIPRISPFQLAREKNACARSWDQARAGEHPGHCAFRGLRDLAGDMAAQVANVGGVKEPRRFASTASSDAGNVRSASIGGSPRPRRYPHRRCFSVVQRTWLPISPKPTDPATPHSPARTTTAEYCRNGSNPADDGETFTSPAGSREPERGATWR